MEETKREKQYRHYIDSFYKIASRELKFYPKELEEFNKHWTERNYRFAYLPFMKICNENKIKLSEEEDKIDQEFYGLFVN